MKLDYIIVGCGLAGIAFCEQLRKNNKSFVVYDDVSQQSSIVAGGLYNPVVLKRFTAAWKAKQLRDNLLAPYQILEQYLGFQIIHEQPIYRIFNSVEEQNNWFAASDKPVLSEFLDSKIHDPENPCIKAVLGMGKVLKTGRIDTKALIESYFMKLTDNGIMRQESFIYDALVFDNDQVCYKNLKAKHIIFSEGFGLKKNPYFNYLPLQGSKGEYISIQAPDLKLDYILKGPIFVIPLEDNTYLVGATYDNNNKSNAPSLERKLELQSKLETILSCDYQVVNHIAGIRPTVKDRRPLVGRHPKHDRLSVLNGLGTRGVLASPFIASQLYEHIEHGKLLDPEIDILRYNSLLLG